MKVFLSWSGQRSKAVADLLAKWTPHVIQAVEPWISSAIDKGARWQSETAARLEDVKVGIVCLTPGNLSEPWILFEAGALSKTTGSSVCTFLLDLTPADIAPPLAQFQHTTFQKEDVLKLMQTINQRVGETEERSLSDQSLVEAFEMVWPKLETDLTEVMRTKETSVIPRSDRQLLEELLDVVRAQDLRAEERHAVQLESLAQGLHQCANCGSFYYGSGPCPSCGLC